MQQEKESPLVWRMFPTGLEEERVPKEKSLVCILMSKMPKYPRYIVPAINEIK